MTTQATEDLADFLAREAPGDLKHVYFVSGGSEAIEASLKLARQYFVEIGQSDRRHFIARRQSYHGNTLGALAIGGNAWRRAAFLPLLIASHHVSPCYAYRDQHIGETEEQYAERLAAELEQRSEEHTSELQSLMRISYAVFCLKKKNNDIQNQYTKRNLTKLYMKKTNND